MYKEDWKNKVVDACSNHGASLRHIAKKIGIPKSTVSDFYRNHKKDEHIENEKQEDFYKVQEDIHDTINKQMKIIDKITNHTYKLFYSKNYLNLIKSSTEKIENDIKKANELGELINKTIPEMVIKELEKIERNKNNKDNISTKNNELNLKASDEIDFKKHSD